IPFILVGNKVDLLHLRKVTFSEASARAAEWNCPYVETSAKTRQNVEEVYTQLMRKIRDRKERISKREGKGKKGKCLILREKGGDGGDRWNGVSKVCRMVLGCRREAVGVCWCRTGKSLDVRV
ncbi:hypothetical protein BC937DRAFT_86477, partial [Endogone sp. FLAS-F59071]